MPHQLPASLERLLEAKDPDAREHAWADFLHEYNDLIRFVTRRLGGDEDAAMDRYTFVLGALRENDFHRLRRFRALGRGKFSTWLVAVVRRLCVDEHRRRYGRPQGGGEPSWRIARRNLAELVGAELELERVEAPGERADAALERREAVEALASALARLTTSERVLLRFRLEDGLSVPEIARMTGRSSPFPVYRELEKVLATLRQALEQVGVEWSGE